MKTLSFLLVAIAAIFLSCNTTKSKTVSSEKLAIVEELKTTTLSRPLAKFEPADEKCLLFVGQELEAIGGLAAPYNDGYMDHFKKPAGFTMYTNLSVGDTSFGYVLKGLDGLKRTDDWGDYPSNMAMQLADPDFDNMALAIGLWMVNHEEDVAAGKMDHLIEEMGDFFISLGNRPVFLRIGYEFDGHVWNFYEREPFIAAYKRIKDRLDAQGVTNVAYVWQSTGWVSTPKQLMEWYPGDAYVDWLGCSFFNRWREIEMFELGRKLGKPVFIAEASPTISSHMAKFDGTTIETILSNPTQADEAWKKWFVPFFEAIEEYKDVVKAVNYINCHWKSHPMWYDNPTFKMVDARLQTSEKISRLWNERLNSGDFILSTEELYSKLSN